MEISQVTLGNGLRVVLVHDPRASQIQVTMRYAVGAVDDPAGREGMAHLVEHLMFQQIVGAQSVFVKLENDASYFNATTTLDATTYVSRAPAEKLEELLSIEGVRLGLRCTSITDSVFERERSVVLQEQKLENDAAALLEAVRAGAYPDGHAYRRNEGGTPESVGAITRTEACAFADAHYTPDRAVIVVSGAFAPERLDAGLGKYLARIPKRAAAAPVGVAQVPWVSRELTVPAPIDDDALVVAWPLPEDPKLRAKVRAVAKIAYALVDGRLRGRVVLGEIGDARAPMLALFVLPSLDETFTQAKRGAERALGEAPLVFLASGLAKLDRFVFERTKQTAIAELFGTLEDGSGRDERLATYALAGRDASVAVEEEIVGLREMTREDGVRIARDYLGFDRAVVVTLHHDAGKKQGREVKLSPPIHDLGRHRDPPDLALAHQALAGELDKHGFDGARVRSLPNGLRVVLLPITSVPTVDVRLVFRAGTADEPAGARGAALVAADALSWRFTDASDVLLFLAAGGNLDASVDLDRTTFSARGLDMHVDLLLTGVARLVRDGEYGASADTIVSALRRQAKKVDDSGALTDAWRTALYGAHHPYLDAGLPRHASRSLAVADAERFRAAHFNPDNATLIVAGKFDSELADEWIEYLFGSWHGVTPPRETTRAAAQPASLARADDTSLVSLAIALPATAGSAAEQLVAAEMLNEIASDVRFELGASYELSAALSEQRLATNYVIAGSIDAARAAEGIELVKRRIDELRANGDAAARTFVGARQRVVMRLMAVTGGASLLAARVEDDVALGREPNAELAIAEQTRKLSVDAMARVLAELDLARASVMMRGPEDQVRAAYAVLGREPTFIAAPAAASVASHVDADRDDRSESDAEPVDVTPTSRIGAPPAPPPTLSVIAAPGYSTGNAYSRDATGVSVSVDAGWRDDEHGAFGVHTAIGSLSGQYLDGANMMHSLSVIPIDLSVFVRGTAADRVWGVIALGIHFDSATVSGTPMSDVGLGIVLEAGIDFLKLGTHHVGFYGRVDREMAGDANYEVETIGLSYRR